MKYLEACRTLGLESDATTDEAKFAYRRLAQMHHPDKGGDAEKFKRIALAYRVFVKYAPLMRHARQASADFSHSQQSQRRPRQSPPSRFSEEEIESFRRAAAFAEQRHGDRMTENRRILFTLGGLLVLLYPLWRAGGEFTLYYSCLLLDGLLFVIGFSGIFMRCLTNDWSLYIYVFLALLFVAYAMANESARRRVLRASSFWN